jgi:6,7-dimethyl-8-ribityllumazine synthase
MLKAVQRNKRRKSKGRFAIVASRYNARYVDAMVREAQAELRRAGIRKPLIVRVPGAYEIPVVAARLARAGYCEALAPRQGTNTLSNYPVRDAERETWSAIICLGVILRGETVHAAHIGEAVSRALMEIQLQYEIPVIHEVLLLENRDQARARCLGKEHNRGAEAAQTALAMAELMEGLADSPSTR